MPVTLHHIVGSCLGPHAAAPVGICFMPVTDRKGGSVPAGRAGGTNTLIPVRVHGLTGVTAIAAGTFSGHVVRSDGTVYAWGSNAAGALGEGTAAGDSSIRVQIHRLRGITAAAGTGYALRTP